MFLQFCEFLFNVFSVGIVYGVTLMWLDHIRKEVVEILSNLNYYKTELGLNWLRGAVLLILTVLFLIGLVSEFIKWVF